MLDSLLRRFVKNYENISDPKVRRGYGMFSGIIGIICNVILFVLKLAVGVFINSVAVISDAFNNLSDMTSTVVSMLGIRLSGKKPDKDHPYGHGRFEYISALIVAFFIMLVGFELLKSAVSSIFSPTEAQDINYVTVIILALSIPVKFFMYYINKGLGKKINSSVLLATASDSLNDCIATGAVIISTVIDGLKILPFKIDGYVGAIVSVLILKAGFDVAKDTIDRLLGQSPDEEILEELRKMVLETPEIVDIHDLIAHDYGPGRLFASLHAEVNARSDIVSAHEAIDAVEKEVYNKLGCSLTIHLDPVETDCAETNEIKDKIIRSLYESNVSWRFHDVRITRGEKNSNVIFDIVVPYDVDDEKCQKVLGKLKDDIRSLNNIYSCVIQIDRSFE
ncbi:MAG: cation transporter [Ruminococcaceae bacterium]|nr:cation transporter [Oscillospiraceae bacterium]